MSELIYEFQIAEWCISNWVPPIPITTTNDKDALNKAKSLLPINKDDWVQLKPESATSAWSDDQTVAGWNVVGSKGTYQVRLARLHE